MLTGNRYYTLEELESAIERAIGEASYVVDHDESFYKVVFLEAIAPADVRKAHNTVAADLHSQNLPFSSGLDNTSFRITLYPPNCED